MASITFHILATAEQREDIAADFRSLLAALGTDIDADLRVTSHPVSDPALEQAWDDVFGTDPKAEGAQGAELVVEVRRYDLGSLSGLGMHFAELLTTRGKQPEEPLARRVADDPGQPRVPWHIDVRP